MSESSIETPVTPPPPATEPAPEPAKKVKKRRTWKQRFKILILVLLVGGVIIRVGMNFLLPTVVRKVANAYDLDCTYDRMSLGLFSGNAHIWNLVLRPKAGGDSLVHAEYIQGSISTPNLFRGKLVVYRAEVDGVDMLIDREPDGSIPLLARIIAPRDDAPIELKPKPEKSPTTQPVNLRAPLQIDAVRLSHVTTRFRDRSVSPTFETTVKTTLRISDVGSTTEAARLELEVNADPVLDTLLVSGTFHNTPTSIDADLSLLVRGLHPKPATSYLLPLGIKPIADDLKITAKAKLNVNAIPNSADVAGKLTISDVSATADSAEWASLKALTLDAKKVNAAALELSQLLIETGRASARRSAEGRVQIAGFEIIPVAAAASPSKPATPPAPAKVEANTTTRPFRASLEELRLVDLQASFDDQAVRPAGALAARLDELSVKNIVYDTAAPDAVIALQGSASLPGVIQTVSWTGTATPFANVRQAAIKLRAEGIKPDALQPYLDLAGLESDYLHGIFTADVDAKSSASADGISHITAGVSKVRLTDGDVVLFDLPAVTISDFSIDPASGAIRLEAVDVDGPSMSVSRNTNGALAGMGFRVKAAAPAAAGAPSTVAPPTAQVAAAPSTRPATSASAPSLPRIQIGRFTWKEIYFGIADHYGVAEPIELRGSASIEAKNLVFDAASTQPTTPPGVFSARVAVPGVAEVLAASGTIASTGNGATITADLSGKEITGAAIASYLKPLGIELALKDGNFQAKSKASIATNPKDIAVNFDLTDVSYKDGEQELIGVDALRVKGLALSPARVDVESVQITKPSGRITRDADSALEAAGVRLLPAPPAPATQPVAQQPSAPAPPPVLKLHPSPITARLKQFKMEDGALDITDLAVNPPLKTKLHGGVTLDNLSVVSGDAPATIEIKGGLEGIIDSGSLTGTLALSPEAPSANLSITAEGLKGAALAPYLPPGVISTLHDGQFAMKLDAGASNHDKGGLSTHLVVSDLLFKEKASEAALAKVDAFTVRTARIDPAGELLAIDEISSAGVEVSVAKQPSGAIDVLGVRLGDPSKPTPAPATQPAAAPAPATAPTVVVATSQPAPDVAALVADARRPLPLFTIGKIDLKLDRLALSGFAGADAKALNVARVRLHNTGPIELAGAEPEKRPPLKLQIDGGLDPVVKQFAAKIESTPFAAEPALSVDVSATGINGRGLIDIAPELGKTIQADGLTDGVFTTKLVASLSYGRRGARDLDLSRGFTAMFSVKPLEFRAQPKGPVLAGLDEIRGEGIAVQPKSGNVLMKSVEVIKPIGRFVRDEKGLHALGVVIPLATAPATQPATAPSSQPAARPAPATAPVATARAERPASEIRLDRFMVTGIDVVFEDRTTKPTTLVPLKTLDLEVRDISNQMLWTGKPLRFDLLCTSEKVPLPPRKGIKGTSTGAADGTEMRELFSQITASGRIGMKQTDKGTVLTGWAKTSVNGFELLGVRGLAEAQKVKIGGGVFDDSNDIRFKEDGTIETRNRIVFTNLALSEPANGPIQSTLKIPTPINVAIGAVTDADGSITLNLPVSIEQGTTDPDKLLAPAIAAIAQVFTKAIASAPVKTIEGVGGLLGLGGSGKKAPEPPIEIGFLTGVATLDPADARQLAALIARMRRDKNLELQLRHELSTADIEHAGRRANPPLEDVQTITERLRRQKSQLISQRAALAAQTRAQFASQSDTASESVDALRTIDRRLGGINASLDQLYDLLRPGADGQADRRTRAASLSTAKERFDLIQSALVDAGVPDAVNRSRRTNPQFEPQDLPGGGKVVVTLVPKKK